MTWTLDKLRQVAADRGEDFSSKDVGKVLLAHERACGRTEEDYSRDKAARELDALLDGLTSPLSQIGARGYPGLRQLLRYAADRTLAQGPSRTKAEEKAKSESVRAPRGVITIMRNYVQSEPERERG